MPLKHFKAALLALIFCGLISLPFISKLETSSFHGDENLWLKMSLYFDTVFLNGTLESQESLEFHVFDQPAIGKFIFGLQYFLMDGRKTFVKISQMPDWNHLIDNEKNRLAGAYPPSEILRRARLTSLLFGVFCCVLIFFIGRKIFSSMVGTLAALTIAYNPLMANSCCRAMTDAPLLFFMTAVPLLTITFFGLLQKRNWNLALISSVLIGLVVGLAAGTKLNGALSGFVFALFCFEIVISEILKYPKPFKKETLLKSFIQKGVIRTATASSITAAVISFLVFIFFNPILHSNSAKGSLRMVGQRIKVTEIQQSVFPARAAIGPANKLFLVFKNSLVSSHNSTFFNHLEIPLDLIFFVIGLIYLCCREIKNLRDTGNPSRFSLVIIWTITTYAGTILWLPMDWDRYYLPVFPSVSVFVALGIYVSLQYGRKLLNQAPSPTVSH